MRIISGTSRGTKLFSPPGMDTRPMLDRVKGSLFNIIANEINDCIVIDLFAGSGALGLEALSRGAKFCYFVESGQHVKKVISQNIEKTGMIEKCKLLTCDAYKIFSIVAGIKFDLFFFDPPYIHFDNPATRRKCIEFLAQLAKQSSAKNGMIIMHYRKGAMAGFPIPAPLEIEDNRTYGTTELMFLRVVL